MKRFFLARLIVLLLVLAGCSESEAAPVGTGTESGVLALPAVQAAGLDGRPLRVVATTSMIGDVLARVGGEAIELTTLMALGQDPHSYQPGAGELTAVAEADVLFVNGWDLEENLAQTLETIAGETLIVPISAGIEPLAFGGHADEAEEAHEDGVEEEDDHAGADPHVWLDVANVQQWARNAAQVLGELDPANAAVYTANAAAYDAELAALDEALRAELAAIPAERRALVTNHESLNYFAQAYGFETLGTVIPAASTLAEPSARDLAELIALMDEHNVCTIFAETTVSEALAQTVAAELAGCAAVAVRPLYTGSLGPAGSGADSYAGMMRANVAEIVAGLR